MSVEVTKTTSAELVIISAADDAALVAEAQRILAFTNRVNDVPLVDIAYTACLMTGPARLALVATDVPDLRARLSTAIARLSAGAMRIKDKSGTYYFRTPLLAGEDASSRLAFVYPGVMSFYPDMLRDLAVASRTCRGAFDELEEALSDDNSFTPSNFIFPPAAYYRHDADIFSSGAYAQALVSVYAASVALTRLCALYGLSPKGVVGCAGGDLAAAMRSGAAGEAVPRAERIRAIREVYQVVNKFVNHAGLPPVVVVTLLLRHAGEEEPILAAFPKGRVVPVLDFSPRQKTYVIAPEFESEAMAAFAAAGIRVMKLALDRPFNTPACERLVPVIRKVAGNWMRRPATCEVYSCATAQKLSPKPRAIRNDTAERWATCVRFSETIRQMYADGYRVFVEVGPRGILTSAIEDTLKGSEFAAVALNSIHRQGMLQLQLAFAQLAAQGATLNIASSFECRHARRVNFDSSLSYGVRRDAEMRLSRAFPRLVLLGDDQRLAGAEFLAEPKGRGAKARERQAALAERQRRQRQFDFGAVNPLVSDADELSSCPGISCEIVKTFQFTEAPFLADFAYGASQLSYSDPNLKGLVLLPMTVAAEVMAETALKVMPGRVLVAIEDLNARRLVFFSRGSLRVFVRAERVASGDPEVAAVMVQLRDDSPNSAYTSPVMEATFRLAVKPPLGRPAEVVPLARPRSVHWSGRDIYPSRLGCGRRLRGITFAEMWGEDGIDYEVEVPPLAGNVNFTNFPQWVVNPLLLQMVSSGFLLWRSHERFLGAFSFPFRLRRLDLRGQVPKEGTRLKCYLRLTGVTPKSHISDIVVTAGNGQVVMELNGWEEFTERVPQEFCEMVLQPANCFVTSAFSSEVLGSPATEVSSAYVTRLSYPIFERNEELWLRILSHVALGARERKEFAEMSGSVSRRAEWLFGRIAAKEAVRRFLKDYHQARWSDADVQIWANEKGKPQAIGAWGDYLTTRLDVAIAHTAQFVVALVAANARVGVDVESVARDLSEEFTNGVFTPEELELAANAANSANAIIRFWCAKEAVSKALGTGIRYSPKELMVTDYQADTGRLQVRLEGAWQEAFKVFKGRAIEVKTCLHDEHALAFCFIPETLFGEN